jgi:proteasome lid subunit RPN8/RPN11
LTVQLDEVLRRQIIDHCLAALPNEGCGMLAMDGTRVAAVYPTGNQDTSPVSYTVPPREHFDALIEAESRGWVLGGVFHSHPHGPAAMSATDLARVTDPTWLYIVVSLAGPDPVLVGWRDGRDVVVS